MSLTTQLTNVINAIGADVKSLFATRGTLSNLTTTEKSNLVDAINEVKAGAGGSSGISDGTTTTSTTWSSTKIDSSISAAIDNLKAGAPAAFDTLNELAAELATQGSAATALTTAVANRVRFDAAQALDATQKAQANANIGSLSLVNAGNPDTDFVAIYTAAKS